MRNMASRIFEKLKKWRGTLLLSLGLFVGFIAGNISSHYVLRFEYGVIKSNFEEIKIFTEVFYFVLASLLIPIAFFQYMSDRQKDKKGDVQYTNKLYLLYVNDILPLDEKYTPSLLEKLTPSRDSDDFKKFNELLNKLDVFAAAFVHDVADPDTGKVMMGSAYCGQIEKYLPTISRISGDNYQKGLENMFCLYDKWKNENG